MGIRKSIHIIYGTEVPEYRWAKGNIYDEADRLDGVIAELGVGSKLVGVGSKSAGVGQLCAGAYDRDRLFLRITTERLTVEVQMGKYQRLVRLPEMDNWDTALRVVADEAGYRQLDDPSWIVVPNESYDPFDL